MAERSDEDLASDLREAAARIRDYVDGLDYAGFLADTKTQDAVVRNIEILGEAPVAGVSCAIRTGRMVADRRNA